MDLSSSAINEFKYKIFEIGIWTAYEIKVALLRLKIDDSWKIGVLHTKLLESENKLHQVLYDHECLRLIREVRDISTLDSFLTDLAKQKLLSFNKQKASFEFISSSFKLEFKNRQYMRSTYLIDNPCYLLEKGPTREQVFRNIEDKLRLKLPRHRCPKEGLKEACKSILNINLGGAYSPHIHVYAPIFLKLKTTEIKNGRIYVFLYSHKRIEKHEVKVNLHSKDEFGGETYDEQLRDFKSKKRDRDVIFSSCTLQRNDRTQDVKIVLYYDKIEFPLEEYFRPLRVEPIPILGAAQIQRKKQAIKETYNAAKNEANKNKKGKMFENVISDLLELVPGLKKVGKNINSGIEEIDLQVQNDSCLGIWKEFDRLIFVECKNWSDRVGSNEIRNFEGKLRNFWLHAGLFIAIKGFTGKNGEKGAIGQNRIRFKQEGFKIILLDGNDLDKILSSRDTSEIVNEKWLNLFR